MATITELDAIRSLDEVLSRLEDACARDRVLRWACEKFTATSIGRGTDDERGKTTIRSAARDGHKKKPLPAKAKGRVKTPPSFVRDLNLKPTGKKSLDDFAAQKLPRSHQHRGVLSVYYLLNELGLANVSVNHIYTCFKHMKWRVPSDLRNTLQYAASHNGWLNTTSMSSIKLTTIGENLVEHDMPTKVARD
jgi:hypothetical protein